MKKTLSITTGAATFLGIALWLLYSGAAFVNADPCQPGDGRAIVRPEGDSVCLQGVATVEFPAGAFAGPTEITLKATSDQDVAKLFKETTAMFLPAGRLGYELRIGTGATPPRSANVQVTMPVPEELQRFTLAGHTLEAFAAIDRGSARGAPLSMFELLESRFDVTTQTVSVQLPGVAFAANELAQGGVQAIVTLAPTLSGGDCH